MKTQHGWLIPSCQSRVGDCKGKACSAVAHGSSGRGLLREGHLRKGTVGNCARQGGCVLTCHWFQGIVSITSVLQLSWELEALFSPKWEKGNFY